MFAPDTRVSVSNCNSVYQNTLRNSGDDLNNKLIKNFRNVIDKIWPVIMIRILFIKQIPQSNLKQTFLTIIIKMKMLKKPIRKNMILI